MNIMITNRKNYLMVYYVTFKFIINRIKKWINAFVQFNPTLIKYVKSLLLSFPYLYSINAKITI